jgi:hypothetical protein
MEDEQAIVDEQSGVLEVEEPEVVRISEKTDNPETCTTLPKSCSVLTCNDPYNPFGGEQTFYLVGTAHVSLDSCEDVRRVIRLVKPEVNCISIPLQLQ